MKSLLSKVICIFKGHGYSLRQFYETDIKTCNRCGKILPYNDGISNPEKS